LEILKVEAPLSEEWLIKRIAFMFGREKVTTVVREGYTRAMLGCSKMGVVKRGGFLYLKDKPIPMLRVPKDGAKVIRDIKYISLEELSSGILEILKQNVSVEKSGLFRLIAKQLGFTRIGDAICERLQSALNTISDKIIVNGEVISLK
jgi:hypothetical protein